MGQGGESWGGEQSLQFWVIGLVVLFNFKNCTCIILIKIKIENKNRQGLAGEQAEAWEMEWMVQSLTVCCPKVWELGVTLSRPWTPPRARWLTKCPWRLQKWALSLKDCTPSSAQGNKTLEKKAWSHLHRPHHSEGRAGAEGRDACLGCPTSFLFTGSFYS